MGLGFRGRITRERVGVPGLGRAGEVADQLAGHLEGLDGALSVLGVEVKLGQKGGKDPPRSHLPKPVLKGFGDNRGRG